MSQHPTFVTGSLHADAYDAMQHDPYNPEVVRSYAALATAIAGQWNGLRAAGFEFIACEEDPYDSSDDMFSWASSDDYSGAPGVLKVFTDGGATLPWNHPMRQAPTAWGCLDAESRGFRTLNDVFRGVHDVMGHLAAHNRGEVASFGPVGEYNAWRQHYRTLPPEAYMALWCETRGQNAWTNFYGDHLELELPARPYAVQKAGVPALPLIPTPVLVHPWITR